MNFKYNYILDNISMAHSRDEKPEQKNFKVHIHNKYELYFFISGKGIYHIEGSHYKLKPNDIVILGDTESHYIEIDSNYPYERFTIHFKKEFLTDFDEEGKLSKIYRNRKAGKNNVLREEDFGSRFYLEAIKNMIEGIHNNKAQARVNFLALLCEVNKTYERVSNETEATEETLTNKIVKYILDNLKENISLDDICDKFFISKAHLLRKFKKSVGMTVWSYITAKRLAMARQMIEAGLNPTSVYLECGFLDYSTFYRAYKKYYKNPPSKT